MKRMLCFMLVLALLCAGCSPACTSERAEKNADQPVYTEDQEILSDRTPVLPEKNAAASMEEAELLDLCRGMTRDEAIALWGESVGQLSGLYGEAWNVNDAVRITLYYDGDSCIENVRITAITKDAQEAVNDYDVVLTAENVTPKGLTLVCTQTMPEAAEANPSGKRPTGELSTGSWYVLEQLVQGEWQKVEMILDESTVGWTAEAWMISENDTVEWEVNWAWLYGSLDSGEYRIGKEIMDFREAGDYDTVMLYAYFEILEN